MGGSHHAEDDGSGQILRVNRGGAVWTAGGGAVMQQGRRRAVFAGARARAASGPASPFIGGARTPARGLATMGVLAVPAMDTGQRLGPDGLHTGALVGPDEMGRAFGLGLVGKDRVLFCF
jgi:hypothetical protein